MNDSFKTVFTEEEDFTEPNRTLHCTGLHEIIVHKQEIGKLLENLDVRKAVRLDGVSGWAVKECKDQLLEPIWEMVTSSLKEGRVPLEWKRDKIIPIFKGGKSPEPLNYLQMLRTGEQRWKGGHSIPGHKKRKEKKNIYIYKAFDKSPT
ncbi:hypothetical protein E2C01_013578 [Portunus trituberculatus]|uniref:Rna-directed dna polymerase from mobile element jockey-like n=1 Tax=Portunus trituberculatus TaxID=210409 RepID=A0A5B7DHN9_PORTR|nr:hypothetical protein [Portunus trituberculatus]